MDVQPRDYRRGLLFLAADFHWESTLTLLIFRVVFSIRSPKTPEQSRGPTNSGLRSARIWVVFTGVPMQNVRPRHSPLLSVQPAPTPACRKVSTNWRFPPPRQKRLHRL